MSGFLKFSFTNSTSVLESDISQGKKGKRRQFTKATVTTTCLETGLTRNILILHKTQSNIIKSKTFLKM